MLLVIRRGVGNVVLIQSQSLALEAAFAGYVLDLLRSWCALIIELEVGIGIGTRFVNYGTANWRSLVLHMLKLAKLVKGRKEVQEPPGDVLVEKMDRPRRRSNQCVEQLGRGSSSLAFLA